MPFCGIVIYETMLATPAKSASIMTGRLTAIALSTDAPVMSGKKYKITTPSAIKSVASQIRRCQKRLNATG